MGFSGKNRPVSAAFRYDAGNQSEQAFRAQSGESVFNGIVPGVWCAATADGGNRGGDFGLMAARA